MALAIINSISNKHVWNNFFLTNNKEILLDLGHGIIAELLFAKARAEHHGEENMVTSRCEKFSFW